MSDYKFCPCCGLKMYTKEGESGWSRIKLCGDASCRTLVYIVDGDMGETDTSYLHLLSPADWENMYAKVKNDSMQRLDDTNGVSSMLRQVMPVIKPKFEPENVRLKFNNGHYMIIKKLDNKYYSICITTKPDANLIWDQTAALDDMTRYLFVNRDYIYYRAFCLVTDQPYKECPIGTDRNY